MVLLSRKKTRAIDTIQANMQDLFKQHKADDKIDLSVFPHFEEVLFEALHIEKASTQKKKRILQSLCHTLNIEMEDKTNVRVLCTDLYKYMKHSFCFQHPVLHFKPDSPEGIVWDTIKFWIASEVYNELRKDYSLTKTDESNKIEHIKNLIHWAEDNNPTPSSLNTLLLSNLVKGYLVKTLVTDRVIRVFKTKIIDPWVNYIVRGKNKYLPPNELATVIYNHRPTTKSHVQVISDIFSRPRRNKHTSSSRNSNTRKRRVSSSSISMRD